MDIIAFVTPYQSIYCWLIYTFCFHLAGNNLRSIPPEIGNLRSLQTLYLGECMVLEWFENHSNLIVPVHSLEFNALYTPFQSLFAGSFQLLVSI
jgi:hypothetical protein